MSFFYAVKKGHRPAVYTNWEECFEQVDGYSGAEFKRFKTLDEAQTFLESETKVLSLSPMSSSGGGGGGGLSPSVPLTELSREQQYAFDRFKKGHNLFITGPGGTGKSHLIKTIKADLVARDVTHAVCALTGCAAVLLNCCAKTIHSWSGIGLAAGEIHEIVDKVTRNSRAVKNWKSTRVLIVDEVSMLSLKLFDVLNRVGQNIRKNYSRPFGGIQLIFIGDFFQLPPVGKYTEPETTMFCFQSDAWFSTFSKENHIQLKTLYRQKDPTYIKVLNEVRQGVISPESVEILNKRTEVKFVDTATRDPGVPPFVPTKLFPTNADAERVNQIMFMKINEPEKVYECCVETNYKTFVESGTPIPAEIIKQCDLMKYEDRNLHIDLLIENSKINKELRLKKGALVMCLANLDVEGGICNGSQGVVVGFSGPSPIVEFLNGVVMTVSRKTYQHGDYPCLGVEQIPLRLAWAFTIHKSQGITLDIAEMDLGSKVFECGQSYVGLSRVRNLDGLYLSCFNPKKIKSNPEVIKFYNQIPEVPEIEEEEEQEPAQDFSKFAYQPDVKIMKL